MFGLFNKKEKPVKVKKQIDVGKVTIRFTFPNGDTFDSIRYGWYSSYSGPNTAINSILSINLRELKEIVNDTKNPKVKIRSEVSPIKAEIIKKESYIEEYEEN